MATKKKSAPVAGNPGEKLTPAPDDASPEALLARIADLEARLKKLEAN